MNSEEILRKIKKARREKGISQKEMAEKININQSSYGKLEAGQSILSIDRLLEISNILELDIHITFNYNELKAENERLMKQVEELRYINKLQKEVIEKHNLLES
jgi:transcriptional regulator with XRE-family HTH domain